jgi:hypothetical protein
MNESRWTRGQLAVTAGTSVVLLLLGVAEMRERNERRELAAEIEKMRREVAQLRAKADAERASTDGGTRD